MQYYYQTDLYNIKSPNRKAQAITMMGNNTSTTVAQDTPSSISAPGRRVSSLSTESSRGSRNSSSSPAGSRRSSSRLKSASITAEPAVQVQVQVQAPAPIAQMVPAYPNPHHPPLPMNPTGLTPLQIWNTVPNAIMGARAAALAMAANPPSVPEPKLVPSTQDNMLNDEDEYRELEVGDEDMADDEEDESDLEQHIKDIKQHRDSLILELMRVQAAATTTANKTKSKTTKRRQPSRKSKSKKTKISKTAASLGTVRTQRKRVVVVSDDVPARNTRSRRAGRGGAQFGAGELEGVIRRVRGGRRERVREGVGREGKK